ncbi:MAG: hypothetical protein ACRDHP_19555 [Ktedonobacterales bacterium]
MSMRPEVDHSRIEQFLSRLGKLTNVPVRVLLVGGCAVVHAGLRTRTLDIDLALEGQGESEVLTFQRQQLTSDATSPESSGDASPLPDSPHPAKEEPE